MKNVATPDPAKDAGAVGGVTHPDWQMLGGAPPLPVSANGAHEDGLKYPQEQTGPANRQS